jgi:hexokinase
VVELRNDPHLGAIAQALINRSADLVAAALGGLIGAYTPQDGGKDVGILAEGSLFWKTPGYSDRVIATLARLLAPGESANIIPIPTDAVSGQRLDPNWIGAASAALSR